MEAAFAIAALAAVLVLCLAGASAMAAQVRCVDSAREAARLAARGDDRAAADAVRRAGPRGASLQLRPDGEFVVATVRAEVAMGFAVAGQAVAAREPGV